MSQKTESQVKQQTKDLKDHIFDQAEINTDIGTFYWNLNTQELSYSDNFYRILGCEPGEFEPNIDYFNKRFLHPDDRGKIEMARSQVQQTGEADSWEYRIITKSGHIKYIKAHSKFINVNGERILVGNLQNITSDIIKVRQLKKRQEELRLKNIELKTSLKVIHNAEISAGLGHWHINLETNHFYISENLKKISGLIIDERTTLESVLSMVHPDDRQNLVETSMKDFELNRTSISVFRMIKPDGQIRYIKGTSDKMRINKVYYLVGIFQDITSLIDKEIMLEEKNLQLERKNEELASFNHMASHDLQEPLRKIQIISKMIIENEKELSEVSVGYFKRMIQSANRMQTLINDLLNYSRANDLLAIKERTDLNVILKAAIHNMQDEINISKAIIHFDPLPILTVIPSQIEQLFINLLDNALKYTRKEVKPIINITTKIVPGESVTGYGIKEITHYYCINFTDNGIGFDQKYAHKIFDIFQRLHGKNEFSGTGIGLTICKKVVQNHNGYITASGQLNRGASFNIFLPVEETSDITSIE